MNLWDTPQVRVATVTNILYKLAGYSSVLMIADFLIPNLYPSLVPLFATVLALTFVGAIADLVIVPILGSIVSLLIGASGMVLILDWMARGWPGSHVTWTRAFVLTLAIGPLEFALHKYILRVLFPGEDSDTL